MKPTLNNGELLFGDKSFTVDDLKRGTIIVFKDPEDENNSLIKRIDREDINLMIPLELIDFTLTEYVKDSVQLGFNRAILAPGHFNVEEPGMKYMEEWLPGQLKEKIAVTYVQAGDMYEFL